MGRGGWEGGGGCGRKRGNSCGEAMGLWRNGGNGWVCGMTRVVEL